MIQITKIFPVGSPSSIEVRSIQNEYLRRIKLYSNPLTLLIKSINEQRLISYHDVVWVEPLNQDQLTILAYLRDHFNSIIIALPDNLQNHINNINNSVIGAEMNTTFGLRFVLNEFGRGIYDIFGYERHFRSLQSKGIWLAKQLNIKSCPYCNGQYTLIISKSTTSSKAKFQFDHFFSKKRYPYLSLSLYNLIPSCAPCNLSKGSLETTLQNHYNPYQKNLALRSIFKLKYDIDIKKLSIGKTNAVNTKIVFKAKYSQFDDFIKEHNKIYEIESIYNRHTDIVEDLLHKAIVNNRSSKLDILKIKGLFNGDEKLYKRYLIGNYAYEDEIFNRPLAKFTQDIAKQLGLI